MELLFRISTILERSTRTAYFQKLQWNRQGDPLGPFVFCAGIQSFLEDIQTLFPNIEVNAYIDDVILLGDDLDLAESFKWIQQHIPAIGLQLIINKCRFLKGKGSICPSTLSKYITEATEGLRILGSPVGSDEFCTSFVVNAVREIFPLFDFLPNLSLQVSFILLQESLNSHLSFLLRTTPPSLSQEGAAIFDKKCFQLLAKFGQFDPECVDEDIISQTSLPIRLGGLGLRSAENLRFISYLSSVLLNVDPSNLHDTQELKKSFNSIIHLHNPSFETILLSEFDSLEQRASAFTPT